MGFRDKIKTMKTDLVKTTQESIDRGEDRPDYGSVFIKENIPEGVGFWRPDFGEHMIDVVPFQAAGCDPRVPKGRWTYLVDYWAHLSVGAMFDHFVCQVRAWKEPDPMCQYLQATRLPTDEWKKIAPKRRTGYLIWCHDSVEEEEKGIQIWEVAHWNFEKHLSKISKNPKGGAPVPFSHVIDGKLIAFEIVKSGTFVNQQGKEQDSKDFVGHRFLDREEEIPDEFGDKIFPLDSCIDFRPSWDRMAKAFPLNAEKDKTPLPSQEKQSDDTPIEDPDPVEELEKDSKRFQERANKELECPAGGTIGVDLEKLSECNNCDDWDACADEADKIKAKEAKEKKKEKPPAEKPREKKKIIRRRRRTLSE